MLDLVVVTVFEDGELIGRNPINIVVSFVDTTLGYLSCLLINSDRAEGGRSFDYSFSG